MNSVWDDPRWAGFPHSDICGSKGARASPQLFAACHVLHRLSVPRHPPNALIALDRLNPSRTDAKTGKSPNASTTGHKPAKPTSTIPQNARAKQSHIIFSDGHRHEHKAREIIGETPRPSHKPMPDLKRLATYSQCLGTTPTKTTVRQKAPYSAS